MALENCFKRYPSLTNFPAAIDVNNVVYERNNGKNKPLFNDLLLMTEKLLDFGYKKENIYCICDPRLRKNIDKKFEFEALINEGFIKPVPARKKADEFILSLALKFPFCLIISNDLYREYQDQLPSKEWLEDRRVSFMFIGEEVCLSPNINYEKIENLYNKKNLLKNEDRTTLEVLDNIEHSEGEFDLF